MDILYDVAPRDIRSALVKRGDEVEELAISYLPQHLKYTASQVRSIVESYRRSEDTLMLQLENLYELKNLIYYFSILSYLLSNNKKISEELIKKYSTLFEQISGNFSARNIRNIIENLSEYISGNSHINNILKILDNIEKFGIYKWIVKQRRLDSFERAARRVIFQGGSGSSINRGVKFFIRIFIHPSNIPLAYKISYNINELKKYKIYGDYYTTMVTLRSGAFEDVETPTAFKLRQRIARRLLCEGRGGRCEGIRVRIKSVRGLVRAVAYLSGDPIKYERGAYDIGKNYCSKLKCDICPINSICKKYTFIEIK
nr:MAG: hypothetical protein TU35_00340 [Thermoproteus sp. AZ2]